MPSETNSVPPPDPGDVRLLVVDDSPMVLKFAARVLRELDHPVQTAENGRLALETLGRQPPDVLITDLMMPEMDGFELIERVRSDVRFQGIHIIVMTALDQVADKVRALELGANDYTVKPLDANEFRARVQAGVREIKLKKQLTAALASLDQELKMVANLQRRLLPKTLPTDERFQAAVWYRPCSRAGGDYYDLFTDAAGRTFLAVGDVSGHGASASVLMAMLRALLKLFAPEGRSAGEVIDRLNQVLLDNIGDDPDFISVFLGLLEPHRPRLNYCPAGHGDMIVLGPEPGQTRRLEALGTVLGVLPGTWTDAWLDVLPGQSLILYTDGLVEAVDRGGEEFGRNRLERLLADLDPALPPDELIDRIVSEVESFTCQTDFADDVTLFVIRFV
jgi:sigma-B regulation protein RsbU (phosphoserine phosphatase)